MEAGKQRELAGHAARITNALANGLYGIVLDKTLIDDSAIDDLLSRSGLTQVIKKWTHGDITVYYINIGKLRKLCLYAECANKPLHGRDRCLQECVNKRYNELAKAIRETLKESL